MVLPPEHPVLHILLQGERIPEDPLFIMYDCSCNIAEYGTDSKFCTAFSFYDVKSTDLILRTDLIKIHFIPVFRMNAQVFFYRYSANLYM